MGQNIGVFDSGLGGLSIYRELINLLPNNKIIYFADHKNAPYGTKSQSEIRKLTTTAIGILVLKKCKIIVIACNTATTGGIDFYRRKFPDIYFVGVVPPIKPAAKFSKSKKIIVLSTTATSKSKYLKGLIAEFAADCRVWNFGCQELVEAVENGTIDSEKTKFILKKYLDKPLKEGADAVVLGCTHFPFLEDVVKKIAGRNVKILAPSKPVALQVLKMSQKDTRSRNKKGNGKNLFFTSGNAAKVSKIASRLLNRRITFENPSGTFRAKGSIVGL